MHACAAFPAFNVYMLHVLYILCKLYMLCRQHSYIMVYMEAVHVAESVLAVQVVYVLTVENDVLQLLHGLLDHVPIRRKIQCINNKF